ncbi:MAG: SprT family zinc-dependent metalloprotease [Alistipes sp.]
MESKIIVPDIGEVTLSHTRRARRITLCIRPTGTVRLSYPYGVSQEQVVQFLIQKRQWIAATRQRLAIRYANNEHPTYTPAQIAEFRCQAKAELPARIATLAAQFGFRYGTVTIRSARTKWASCSSRNNLSLSLYMMMLPAHLRDYVIIHELCHTVHHNHSPRFHALVDQCLNGKEKLLNKALRSYIIR